MSMKSMAFDQSTIIMSSDANNNSDSSSTGAITLSTTTSSTNKKSNEKYSLRQRQKRQTNGRNSTAAATANATTSAILKNAGSDQNPEILTAAIKEKPKSKAAPLSKYRRKTANARERTRMREINSAFENLRRCVPHSIGGGCSPESSSPTTSQSPTNEKLTKITTLRLAMKYIRTLTEALTDPSLDTSFLYTSSNSNDSALSSNNNNNNNRISNNNLNGLEAILRTSAISAASTIAPAKSRTPSAKSQQTRGRQKNKQKFEPMSSVSSSSSSSSASSLCSMSPVIDDNNPVPADLGLLLESDGESLHLSEPCLSPLGHSMKPFGCAPVDSGHNLHHSHHHHHHHELELGGLLLESDSESLQFSEPCLSPLGTLDSFNPFGDLLHAEFSEQTSLDMYLT